MSFDTGSIAGVLLVVSATEERAKCIESALRNAGHPLRVIWESTTSGVESLLRLTQPEVVLADQDVRLASRAQVVACCRRVHPDLPVVALGHSLSLEDAVAALADGAEDLVACSDKTQLRHLELVVMREFSKHQNLRRLRKTQSRLADFEARHQSLTESTADAVGLVQEGILLSANHAFGRLLGYDDPTELAGQPLVDFVDLSLQGTVKERLRAVLRGKHVGEAFEMALVGRNGRVDLKAQLILGQQDGERVIEIVIRATPGAAAPVALAPALHGRSSFAAAMATQASGEGVIRTAMLIRLDAFSGLEDRIGHADAQEIGSLVTASLQSALAPQDQLFVFSTDELAVLAHRKELDAIEPLAETLRSKVMGEIFGAGDHDAQVTITVAVFPVGTGDSPEAVTRQIVNEARSASLKGGNRVVMLGAVASAGRNEREEARLAAQTRKAISEDRLKLAYQSIASLEGESRSHYDVLVRILDDSGRELTAGEFLPAAQKYDLMRSVDRWVVNTVLEIVQRYQENHEATTLFVKISEDSLREPDAFLEWLKAALNGRQMKPDEVVFEFQELVVRNHIRKAKMLTAELGKLGAGIAIEHFGIGANSVQLLDHITPKYLKFHASYTQNFGDKETQKRLIDLVEAAKAQDIKSIVSHVEDSNVMARLWQIGVNFVQGYHVQAPEVVQLSGEDDHHR